MIDFALVVKVVSVLFMMAMVGFLLLGLIYTVFAFIVTRPIQNQPHIVFMRVQGPRYRAFSGHHVKAMADITAGFLKKCGHEAFVHQNLLQLEA